MEIRKIWLVLSLVFAFACAGGGYAKGRLSLQKESIVAAFKRVVPSAVLVATLSCGAISCSYQNVAPHLGLVSEKTMHLREVNASVDVVIAVQTELDGDYFREHVYVIRPSGNYELGKVMAQSRGKLTVRTYDGDEIIISEDEIVGYLIDDYEHVGKEIKLFSEEVGIDYVRGAIFGGYMDDNGNEFVAIKLLDKVDFYGETEELNESDIPFIRISHVVNLDLDGSSYK